jgi:hypothetical protein
MPRGTMRSVHVVSPCHHCIVTLKIVERRLLSDKMKDGNLFFVKGIQVNYALKFCSII